MRTGRYNWGARPASGGVDRTAVLSVQDIRNERLADDLNDITRLVPRQRGSATRARRNARKRMQGAAKQYGKVYYVPKKLRRQWAMIWVGSSFLFGAVQFFIYVAVCRWLDLLP